jgi:hypothetical protein
MAGVERGMAERRHMPLVPRRERKGNAAILRLGEPSAQAAKAHVHTLPYPNSC